MKGWHSTGKPNMKSNECIKLSQYKSWSEISSDCKTKEQSRSQPVRITQLLDSKTINRNVRKRAQPERLKKVLSNEKKVGLIQKNNVREKSQQKDFMKTSLYNKHILSNSNSNKKDMSSNLIRYDRKVRRNLNLNFVSPKQKMEKNSSTVLSEIPEENKSICSNSNNYYNSKSFLLPPNFIKSMYLKQRCSKVMPSSTVSIKNSMITNLDMLEASENLNIKDPNIQICSFIQSIHDNSQREVNLKLQKLLQYDCESKRNTLHNSIDNEVPLSCDESVFIRKNITSTDNNIQKEEHCNINRSNSFMNKNIDNLKDSCNESKNIIFTEGSEVSVNDNTVGFSRKDHLYVDRNAIVSLKSSLEDLLNIFQDNALKTDLVLKRINKILYVNTDSMEEQVHTVDSNGKIMRETLQMYHEGKTEENNIDIISSKSKKNNNKARTEAPVELSGDEKENDIYKNLEFQFDHNKSLQLNPQILQITIPNYAKFGESALQDYINLKSSLNFLETPSNKKFKPRIQKNRNVVPNIPKDKSYLSTKIFTELQNLYDE
ncbi:asparagine-rich protein-like isoform X1 [Vespula squamosa]|uniref:Asparagine-rich protein-like isoform X1 n=1 Tax=Vespula squamosa TaxID=30214 RepID=A0ABD1ZYX5_VESSQ